MKSTSLQDTLDAYEKSLRDRISNSEAHFARREMEHHILCEIQARMELGDSEAEAQRAALAALGDLQLTAQSERRDRRDLALLAAPILAGFGVLAQFLLHDPGPQYGGSSGLGLVAFFPALFALMIGSLGHSSPRFRPLLKGWALSSLGLSTVVILFAPSVAAKVLNSVFLSLGLLLATGGLHLAMVVGRILALREQELRGSFWLRVAGPVVYCGLFPTVAIHFPAIALFWIPALALLLFALGIVGRRKFDFVSLFVGAGLSLIGSCLAFPPAWAQGVPPSRLFVSMATLVLSLSMLQVVILATGALLRWPRATGGTA